MSGELAHLTEIKPRRGWASLGLAEVWEFRDLLFFLTTREIKGRYRQMALGPLWIVLKPFLTMVVLTLVFGRLAKVPSDGVPYPLFSYSALLPWTMFAVSVSKAATSLVANMSVISKVYFPRLIVPLSSTFVGLVDFCFSFVILLAMMAFYGVMPGWHVVYLPVFLGMALCTSLAIGLCLATLAVKYRDVSFAVDHVLQVAMYLTPVAYPSSMVPEHLRWIYQLNPMAVVIEGFRWALLGIGQAPGWPAAVSAAGVLLLLIIGASTFRRTERNVVDML
ncbi:MAG: ABC transporter permease [Pseudomonadota bacterium]